jgi:hypothetical protein
VLLAQQMPMETAVNAVLFLQVLEVGAVVATVAALLAARVVAVLTTAVLELRLVVLET